MLNRTQLERYADVLIWGLKTAREGKFAKNDIVLIQYERPAAALMEIVFGKLLDMGINPVQRTGLTCRLEHTFYKTAGPRQLVFVAPGEKELIENLNGRIFLRAPESLTHLSDIDPARIGKLLISRKPLREIMDRRENQGVYAWTLCTMPTEALAKSAGLTLKQYTNQIIKACYLDKSDPVQEWSRIYKEMSGIKKWLNSLKIEYLHVESDNIDLKVTPGEKRTWIGISGHNIPSFEIFTSPDWRGTEGTYYADQPSFRTGNYVEGVRLNFKKGSVVKVEAQKGREFTVKQLKMDSGANKVGEFSLTDRRFSRIDRFMADTLYDENYGGRYGNCHIAVGSSYAETYADKVEKTKEFKEEKGYNDSALHWDLVNTEKKTVTAHLVSGKNLVIYDSGVFKD